MADAVKEGIRVVRGIDWEWEEQDGGEGHVGTVVEVGGQGSSKNPSGTVVVIWDSGIKANYRAGYDYKDDLRVLDNAPAGIRHITVTCDECKQAGLVGYRWKCSVCYDYDLCQYCYMADKHDISHAFFRIDTPYSQSVLVTVRKHSSQVRARGIYVGAKVTRGSHWCYDDLDGGADKQGAVQSVDHAVDSTSYRSWVKVKWDAGKTNDYRRGHDGKVDVKFATAANGELYYVDHIPKLEEYLANILQVGEFVRLDKDVLPAEDRAQMTQEGLCDAVGRVQGYSDWKVTVSYSTDAGRKSYNIPTTYLIKNQRFQVGDKVKIINNMSDFQRLQKDRSQNSNQITAIIGKSGQVVGVDSDGDVKVEIASNRWLLNPLCCILESAVSQGQGQGQGSQNNAVSEEDSKSQSNTDESESATDNLDDFRRILGLLMGMQIPNTSSEPLDLVREAANGNVENVRAIVSRFPGQVNTRFENRTALHVACQGGHQNVVAVLLNAGAKSEISDLQGNTSLHFAVDGNQAVILDMLLKKSTASIDSVNNMRRTALHLAVYGQRVQCVQVLLRYNCDVNVQDSSGDTALHDALTKNNAQIVDSLLATNRIRFELQNAQGFNTIHQAALRADHRALTKMLPLARHLVNVAKSDGFTALHVAALNGYVQTATALIDVGKANMESTNVQRHTALLVAISSGHVPIIELLVLKGANLEAEDSDGDTALHNVLILMRNTRQAVSSIFFNVVFQVQLKNIEKAAQIAQIHAQLGGGQNPAMGWLSVALFLVVKGANLDHRNRNNRSPLDEVTDVSIRNILIKNKPSPRGPASKPSAVTKCMMCTTEPVGVTFRPCGHSVACIECSSRMKQCFSCHEGIQEKVRLPSPAAAAAASVDPSRCLMCRTEPIGVTFEPCGHSVTCVSCSARMQQCFSCHRPIQAKVVGMSMPSADTMPMPMRFGSSRTRQFLDGDEQVVCRQQ